MYKIKQLLLGIFMIFLAVTIQFTFPACEDKKSEDSHEVTVNDPTNDYTVFVQIIGMGSSGCTMGSVEILGENVDDAQVQINKQSLVYDEDSEIYTDDSGVIQYSPGSKYNLVVKHNGVEIASGYTIMPSIPTITNLESPVEHSLNQSLTVEWKAVDHASAIAVLVSTSIYDTTTWEYKEYDTGLMQPSLTSYTIPDTFFNIAGEYSLSIAAYYGVLPGMDMDNPDTTKGYNLEGAAGMFITTNGFPSSPSSGNFIINVGGGGFSSTVPRAAVQRSNSEIFEQKLKKLSQHFLK
jgi:hypothetical protein